MNYRLFVDAIRKTNGGRILVEASNGGNRGEDTEPFVRICVSSEVARDLRIGSPIDISPDFRGL